MIVIDGSYGEGGGQIVRSALTLAALTGQAVRIEAIRAGRDKPGLQAQHLTAVRATAAICNATVRGDALGSMTLEFIPGGPPQPGEYLFDVAEARQGASAGSVGLVFQTVFLPLALSGGPSRLVIKGGTHVPWSPPLPYIQHVFLPTVWRMGLRAQATLKRHGWYPAGGGEAEFQIADFKHPVLETQLTQRGDLKKIWGIAAVSNLPSHIAQRMANRAINLLKAANTQCPLLNIQPTHVEATGPGVGIFLFADYEHMVGGFCAYGRPGLPAEKVAEQVCHALLAHHQSSGAVDPHLADQLILPAAGLTRSACWTTSCVTKHLLTNVWVAQQFINCTIEIRGQPGQTGEIRVTANDE